MKYPLNTLCTVCSQPVPAPVRPSSEYRTALACRKAQVCAEHLTASDVTLDGVLSRYCSNHHAFHPVGDFAFSNRTCRKVSQPSRVPSFPEVDTAVPESSGAGRGPSASVPDAGSPTLGLNHPACRLDASWPFPTDMAGFDDMLEHTPAFGELFDLTPPTSVEDVGMPSSSDPFIEDIYSLLERLTLRSVANIQAAEGVKARAAFLEQKTKVYTALASSFVHGLIAKNVDRLFEHLSETLEDIICCARLDANKVLYNPQTTLRFIEFLLWIISVCEKRKRLFLDAKHTKICSSGGWCVFVDEILCATENQLEGFKLLLSALRRAHELQSSKEVRIVSEWLHVQLSLNRSALKKRKKWMGEYGKEFGIQGSIKKSIGRIILGWKASISLPSSDSPDSRQGEERL